MAIYPLFKNEPFEPEAIVSMTLAYTDVCRTLGLSDADRKETNAVAVKVIEFAGRAIRFCCAIAFSTLYAAEPAQHQNLPLAISRRYGPAARHPGL